MAKVSSWIRTSRPIHKLRILAYLCVGYQLTDNGPITARLIVFRKPHQKPVLIEFSYIAVQINKESAPEFHRNIDVIAVLTTVVVPRRFELRFPA